MKKKRILVVCTGNSARSQMAEGFFHHYGSDNVEAFSAGTHPSFVHPLAISVMREKGVDISGHTSKSINKYVNQPFDYVITVCDSAKEECPVFPNTGKQLHSGITDPAVYIGNDTTAKNAFRKVRDQIEEMVMDFLKNSGWLNKTLNYYPE